MAAFTYDFKYFLRTGRCPRCKALLLSGMSRRLQLGTTAKWWVFPNYTYSRPRPQKIPPQSLHPGIGARVVVNPSGIGVHKETFQTTLGGPGRTVPAVGNPDRARDLGNALGLDMDDTAQIGPLRAYDTDRSLDFDNVRVKCTECGYETWFYE